MTCEECLTQVLDLSSNAFTEWPLPEGQLPPLRQLRLSSNGRLLSAPQEALQGCAGSLQSLDLSGMLSPLSGCYTAKLEGATKYQTMLHAISEILCSRESAVSGLKSQCP